MKGDSLGQSYNSPAIAAPHETLQGMRADPSHRRASFRLLALRRHPPASARKQPPTTQAASSRISPGHLARSAARTRRDRGGGQRQRNVSLDFHRGLREATPSMIRLAAWMEERLGFGNALLFVERHGARRVLRTIKSSVCEWSDSGGRPGWHTRKELRSPGGFLRWSLDGRSRKR